MRDQSKQSQPVVAAKPNPNVLFKRLGDEIVLFHLETDRFYELNRTAARFWELLADGADADRIRAVMFEEFAVTPDQFTAEAEALISSMRKEDLISNDE